MRIKDLISEAPIDQFQTFNMDKEGTFTDQDKQMVTNPARIERAKRFFENTPFVFDLFFVNIVGKTHFDQKYQAYTDEYYGSLEKYSGKTVTPQELKNDFKINIKYNPKAISVVYLSNSAEVDNIPLTPWMMAHRFTHTILNDRPGIPDEFSPHSHNEPLKSAINVFETAVRNFISVAATFNWEKDLFSKFLTMHSARTNNLTLIRAGATGKEIYEIEELGQELLAEFIIKGKIGFTIPKQKTWKKEAFYDAIENYKTAIDQINAAAKPLLKACVGKIFVMP